MKLLLIVAASTVLSSCQPNSTSASGPDPRAASPPAEASQKSKTDAATVTLDATEQEKGHIVVASVGLKDVAATLTIPGHITFNEDQTWHVGAIASGRVDDISARIGDIVSADQILGRLHSHEVHEARAGYQQAKTELERARAEEGYAKQRRDRAARLFELKAGSLQDLETAAADLRNAQAAIERAQSELEKEHAHLTIFRLPIEEPSAVSAHNDEEDDIPILAPAAGLILERKATLGTVVNSGEELFVIANISNLWMIGAASEADLSKLHAGQQVRVEVRAYPEREFTGRILKLGEQLDPSTRTLQIRIVVPNPQGLLKPEMYATATVQQFGRHAALLVPEEAIQEIDGVATVFVRDSANQFRARTVEPGRHVDGGVEIVEGLMPGDAVVVKGGFAVKSQLLKAMIQDE